MLPPLPDLPLSFSTHDEALRLHRDACAASEIGRLEEIGASEEGRPLYAVILGHGTKHATLVAGHHADEPVGPETLRLFVRDVLARPEAYREVLEAFTVAVVPHANPDGEARNRSWIERWPDLGAYLAEADREPPGRDLEFGFPDGERGPLRPENEAVAALLRRHAEDGLALHGSLHGMGFAEGAMLLIERHWCWRTNDLQNAYAEAARREGLGLHDHNRQGEKGFFYVGPGFWTTPEGQAMRSYFEALGQPDQAARFRDSSMEYARRVDDDPLCFVTEVPLFVLEPDPDAPPGVPRRYHALRQRLPELRARAQRGDAPSADELGLRPVPLGAALRLCWTVLVETFSRVAP